MSVKGLDIKRKEDKTVTKPIILHHSLISLFLNTHGIPNNTLVLLCREPKFNAPSSGSKLYLQIRFHALSANFSVGLNLQECDKPTLRLLSSTNKQIYNEI